MRRIDQYPTVAATVDRIPDGDIDGCLFALSVASLTAVGYHAVELDDALGELRGRGVASVQHRLSVGVLLAQRQQAGWAAGRRGDVPARDTAFFQARAISCVAYAVGAIAGSPRERLGEASYEAVAAFRGPDSVMDVLGAYAD